MMQEEKQLLLKDLCARLPYGVKIHVDYTFKPPYNVHLETDCGLVEFNVEKGEYLALTDMDNYSARKRFALENIKPYLRPMSSMTEEEKEEFRKLSDEVLGSYGPYHREYTVHCVRLGIKPGNPHECVDEYVNMGAIDYLNSHLFDYRIVPSTGKTLIESGFALEAPEGMYV